MPEFTLELEDTEVVRSFSHRLNEVLTDPSIRQFFGEANFDGEHLTVEIEGQFPRVTIYFGLLFFIVGGFSMLMWNAGWWALIPGFLFTLVSLVGSSYYWAFVWLLRLRQRGYKGKARLVHAEGLF